MDDFTENVEDAFLDMARGAAEALPDEVVEVRAEVSADAAETWDTVTEETGEPFE